MAKEFQPHLILIDLGMPRMDGYAVAKALRELQLPDAMLAALTGFADPEHREQCASATAKPTATTRSAWRTSSHAT